MLFKIPIVILLLFAPLGFTVRVRLVVPKFARAGSAVTLVCQYDLEGKSLYSVKWYRGNHEFFRYMPKATPSMQAFPVPGIYVDLPGSSAHQVTILNVPKYIGGKISCEVSSDITFSTAHDSKNLTISDMGIRRPVLHLSSNILRPDVPLQINCSAQVTDPLPTITFYVENDKVDSRFVNELGPGLASLTLPNLDEKIPIETRYISPLWIRCEASVRGIYHLPSSSIPIIPQPVPEMSQAFYSLPELATILLAIAMLYVM